VPHADPTHWMQQLWGRPVPHNPATSPEDLAARRDRVEQDSDQFTTDLPDVAQFHERVEMRPEAGRTPTAEIYVPHGEPPFPVFLHLHGGGWFAGSAKQERRFSMNLAARGFVVVNLDYALAPENPFPMGLEDCIYAARWITANIARYDGDAERLAIGGGSAGGNLTAETVLALHGTDKGLDGADLADVPVNVSAALLMFGVLDVRRWIADPHYYGGHSEIYLASYLGPNFSGKLRDPQVSPIEHPDLDKMPPTYLSCGVEDAFLSHSLAMTERLAMLDVPTTLSVVEGADHEFLKVPEGVVPTAAAEFDRIVDWLHAKLAG
jgi:acetyl esterase